MRAAEPTRSANLMLGVSSTTATSEVFMLGGSRLLTAFLILFIGVVALVFAEDSASRQFRSVHSFRSAESENCAG